MAALLPRFPAASSRAGAVTPCALLLGGALLVGCGGSYEPAVVTTPFTAEHAEVFEDGLDFVNDPAALEGRWREDWSRELQDRVGWADLIGIMHVQTLRTDTRPDQQVTFRIIGTVERSLLGASPDDELTLIVHQGDRGYESVNNNERRILNQSFILFVKWYQEGEGSEILPHWHLSPATDPIIERVRWLIRNRRSDDSAEAPAQDDRRVIVVED